MPEALRPLPRPDASTAAYWRAAADGTLALARCARCGMFSHPPDGMCDRCGSADPGFAFEAVSGRAFVRSWTIVRHALLPGFAGDLPYVLVDVEIIEQADLRLTGRLLDGVAASVRVGSAVVVAFEEIGRGFRVPAFRLAVP